MEGSNNTIAHVLAGSEQARFAPHQSAYWGEKDPFRDAPRFCFRQKWVLPHFRRSGALAPSFVDGFRSKVVNATHIGSVDASVRIVKRPELISRPKRKRYSPAQD
jgi:hypothetical protein